MKILVCTDVFLHLHGTFILAQGGEDGSYACHHQCATEYDRARRVRLFAGHFVEQTVEVGGMFLPLSVAQRDFRRRLLEEEVHLQYFLAESLVECDIIFLSFDGGRRTVFPSCSAGVDTETAVKSVFQRADKVGQLAGGAGQAFGNGMGVKIEHNLDPRDFFAPAFGDIICEVPDGKVGELAITYTVIGEVTDNAKFTYGDTEITLKEALSTWEETLENVFKTAAGTEDVKADDGSLYKADSIYVCKHKVAKPRVFIPVFPGTNCEYDSTRAFERAGAEVDVKVFKNLTAEDIHDSVELFEKAIAQAQMIMFPGGFSAGDEPDGSAKFFATAFQNEKIKEAVMKLLNERDGLALGICNGFQALIKLGLVPYGEICGQKEDSPTLTYNTIGRHVSRMVYTKVVSNKSPWLQKAQLGGVYCNPASHGEGRFVANDAWLKKLKENGQIATEYVPVDETGYEGEFNVNGSYMNIEGITSPDGRVLGKMAHSERRDAGVAVNIYGEQDIKIFESGVEYFK